MKMKHNQILAIVIGCTLSLAAVNKEPDPIIGFWRAVKSESSDSKYQNPTGEMEMQFADGGAVTVKMRDPTNGGAAPTQTIEGKFTITPPDRVTITLDGTTQEHYRYLFKDGQLRMEHLDYPVTNTLKRLKAFSL
jgi:hypothetical protein